MSDDMARPRIEFSYWSDPLCVWALVAQTKLDRVRGSHPGSSAC